MRVVATQRSQDAGSERRDCLDQAWGALLEKWGHSLFPLPGRLARPERQLGILQPDALLLTGGADLESAPEATEPCPERERLESRAVTWCRARRVPIVGICRGMQFLLGYHGLLLQKVAGHAGAGPHEVAVTATPFSKSGTAVVNSYHNYGVPSAGRKHSLTVFATDREGRMEGFYELGTLTGGVMWHPERDFEADEWGARVLDDLLTFLATEASSDHTPTKMVPRP